MNFFQEFTLRNRSKEREIKELGSGLLWFATELWLHFLIPPLDYLIESSDVRELIHNWDSLNFYISPGGIQH